MALLICICNLKLIITINSQPCFEVLFATFVISLFVAVPKDTQVLCARPTCVRTTNVQCPMSVLLTTISPLPVGKTSGLIYPLTFPLSTSSHLPLTSMSSTTSYTHYPIPMHGSRNFFMGGWGPTVI